MHRVGFIMREHPQDEQACVVSGAAKNPFRLLRTLRQHVKVAGVIVSDHRAGFSAAGYPVRGFHLRWLKLYARTLVWNLATFPLVLQLFRRSDVVQCHHPHLGLGAAVARRLLPQTSLIVKAHGTALPELAANEYRGIRQRLLALNARLHHLHDRWVLRQADICIVSSDHQVAEMVETYGVDRQRVRRVYNGFDPEFRRIRDRSEDEVERSPRMVFVGRVVPKKGLDHLASVHRTLRQHVPGLELVLVLGKRGAIEHRPTFDHVVAELCQRPGVTTLFDLDEPRLWATLAACDLGIVPSRGYESIPTVVLEMAAAGLPVFATWSWGIPEVVPEPRGLAGDVERDAERLRRFIRTDLASWSSHAHAKDFDSFSYGSLCAEYIRIYDEVQPT